MCLQGAIFLFFAGRIEAIKGNVDAVSNGLVSRTPGGLAVQQEVRHTEIIYSVPGPTGRRAPRENRLASRSGRGTSMAAWEAERGGGICGVGF